MIKWIKWGDTPLVLLFLSPIPMFSFTFLIINGVGVLYRNCHAEIKHSEMRLRCGRNHDVFAADKIKRADGTSASAKATKRNAPYGR